MKSVENQKKMKDSIKEWKNSVELKRKKYIIQIIIKREEDKTDRLIKEENREKEKTGNIQMMEQYTLKKACFNNIHHLFIPKPTHSN